MPCKEWGDYASFNYQNILLNAIGGLKRQLIVNFGRNLSVIILRY